MLKSVQNAINSDNTLKTDPTEQIANLMKWQGYFRTPGRTCSPKTTELNLYVASRTMSNISSIIPAPGFGRVKGGREKCFKPFAIVLPEQRATRAEVLP